MEMGLLPAELPDKEKPEVLRITVWEMVMEHRVGEARGVPVQTDNLLEMEEPDFLITLPDSLFIMQAVVVAELIVELPVQADQEEEEMQEVMEQQIAEEEVVEQITIKLPVVMAVRAL